jgi:hypothetical protein
VAPQGLAQFLGAVKGNGVAAPLIFVKQHLMRHLELYIAHLGIR